MKINAFLYLAHSTHWQQKDIFSHLVQRLFPPRGHTHFFFFFLRFHFPFLFFSVLRVLHGSSFGLLLLLSPATTTTRNFLFHHNENTFLHSSSGRSKRYNGFYRRPMYYRIHLYIYKYIQKLQMIPNIIHIIHTQPDRPNVWRTPTKWNGNNIVVRQENSGQTSKNKNGRSIRSVPESTHTNTDTGTRADTDTVRTWKWIGIFFLWLAVCIRRHCDTFVIIERASSPPLPPKPSGQSSSMGWFYGNCIRFRCSISSVFLSFFIVRSFARAASAILTWLRSTKSNEYRNINVGCNFRPFGS